MHSSEERNISVRLRKQLPCLSLLLVTRAAILRQAPRGVRQVVKSLLFQSSDQGSESPTPYHASVAQAVKSLNAPGQQCSQRLVASHFPVKEEVAGSIPVGSAMPEMVVGQKCLAMRVSSSGRIVDSQSTHRGSIPRTRTNAGIV